MTRKPTLQTIKGHTLPSPQLTKAGKWALLRTIILPFLGILFALDGLLYLLFRFVFHQCYGLLCLLP